MWEVFDLATQATAANQQQVVAPGHRCIQSRRGGEGEIGNLDDARSHHGAFTATALGPYGDRRLALAAADAELAACLDRQHRLADRRRADRLPGVTA